MPASLSDRAVPSRSATAANKPAASRTLGTNPTRPQHAADPQDPQAKRPHPRGCSHSSPRTLRDPRLSQDIARPRANSQTERNIPTAAYCKRYRQNHSELSQVQLPRKHANSCGPGRLAAHARLRPRTSCTLEAKAERYSAGLSARYSGVLWPWASGSEALNNFLALRCSALKRVFGRLG